MPAAITRVDPGRAQRLWIHDRRTRRAGSPKALVSGTDDAGAKRLDPCRIMNRPAWESEARDEPPFPLLQRIETVQSKFHDDEVASFRQPHGGAPHDFIE